MENLPLSLGSRTASLVALRNCKMARSVRSYVRGNTLHYYEWLTSITGRALPQGPAIWIGGDCHLGNLGPVASTQGQIEIQIRDLDQTVIGNPLHDLIRLGLSLATAARDSVLPGLATVDMMERLIEGYENGLGRQTEKEEFSGSVAARKMIRQARQRRWRDLCRERIEGSVSRIPLGKQFWPVSEKERKALELALGEKNALCHLMPEGLDEDSAVNILDAAFWVKGCSSLGGLRYAVLLGAKNNGTGEKRRCLIDIKEAVEATAPAQPEVIMPHDHAERVVEGARQLSPYLGGRMAAAQILGRSVFMRELLPQDMKIDIGRMSRAEAGKFSECLACVVGEAHARQMDPATRKLWKKELRRNQSKTHGTPPWLWSSISELVGFHEVGYLDHCRRLSLGRSPY